MKQDITRILLSVKQGSGEAYNLLFSTVYDELKLMAGKQIDSERKGHTYSRTDLVHEIFIDMIDIDLIDWKNRAHFYGVAAICMRQILIDYARKKLTQKRGGNAINQFVGDEMIEINEQAQELVELDDALKKMSKINQRFVEIVEYRFFGNMTIAETAEVLGISESTVKREWAKAKGWLYKELNMEL